MSSTLQSQLPEDVQRLIQGVTLNRSVADFEQLCNRVADWSASELCMLQPVFYMHLDPDCIPAESTPAATTNIQLARWSLFGIVTTFTELDHSDDSGPGTDAKQYLTSAWNCVTPWLVFFHSQFVMCRADYRPVDRKHAIDLVGNTLRCCIFASAGTTSLIATTPSLYRPIVELWFLALEIQDRELFISQGYASQHASQHSHFDRLTPLELLTPVLVEECVDDEAFMTIVLLEVSGGTGTAASTALKYVKNIRAMVQDRVSTLSTSLKLLVPTMESYCFHFIMEMGKHSAVMREEFIDRQSVKEIFSACRVMFFTGSMDSGHQLSLILSFEYLADLLDHADDTISVLYQALRARAFEIAMVTLKPLEVDLTKIGTDFLATLHNFLVHDKILTSACKRVDAWSNTLRSIARHDETIWERWSALETKIRLYASLRSREEMMRRPLPDQKGWILRCSCGGSAEDVQLMQCAGCEVARYCSRRCQRDSWYSHHRWSCKFLKAAVGSSTPHYVKRSICLLSALEVHEIMRKWEDIQKLIADARRKYPQDQERLVVEVTVDKEEVLVQPLRHYLFLFNGLSEDEVVDSLLSWPDPRGHVHRRSFLCSVIVINDRYSSRQMLFSPRTALDMETVPTLSRIR
ncbi:hypothetical protein DFH29DRAFT_954699 [Suillus ampliporus]|nr:hypothetical protein DFH29DRAFT_954699 [Suillus ampliporus]